MLDLVQVLHERPVSCKKSDERTLGDGDFVEQVLSAAQEQMEYRYRLASDGYNLNKVATRVCDIPHLEPSEVWAISKEPKRVKARSLL